MLLLCLTAALAGVSALPLSGREQHWLPQREEESLGLNEPEYQAAAELGPLVVSLQELSQLEKELEQAEWRQAVKDQVWLDPAVEETEDRYPEFSKKDHEEILYQQNALRNEYPEISFRKSSPINGFVENESGPLRENLVNPNRGMQETELWGEGSENSDQLHRARKTRDD